MSDKEPFKGLEFYRRQYWAEQDRKLNREIAIVMAGILAFSAVVFIVFWLISK